jgi:hypothetical protein
MNWNLGFLKIGRKRKYRPAVNSKNIMDYIMFYDKCFIGLNLFMESKTTISVTGPLRSTSSGFFLEKW